MNASNVQWWCCSYFEVPYHGVSTVNVAGHLSLALRNRSEKRVQRPHILKFQEKGSFLADAHQPILRGIIGIASWQLSFMPCVNETEDNGDPNATRQILLEALRRTEPGFQRLWVSGLPGSIPFAAVDYLLTVDRHERVYKFDPITNMWSSSLDGARPTPSARFFRSSADIPHTPVRLLVFTTSLEVYAFRLCASGFSFEPTETRSKDEAKRTLHKFLNLFTARLHYIRAGSGISLAENYLVQLCLSKITKEQLNSQNPESTIAPSINPFQLSETEAVEDTDDNISPVNNYPVHPGERARHRWCQLPGEHDWIENPDFSFCRTYPLSVPSVRFQRPLIEMRQFFDGFRFPVLSCYYVNAQMNNKNSSTNASGSVNIDPDKRTQISNNDIKRTPSVISSPVRLLRSGQFNASLSLDSFLNSYITKPIGGSVRSRRSRLTRVVRIRLHETDMETIRNSSDSFLPIDTGPTNEISGLMSQLCLSDSVSLSATSSTSGASSRSSWYIPLTSGPPEEKDSNLFVPSRPPSSVKHTHSLYCSTNSLGSEFSWCAPNSQAIQKSWLRLGSLIRLSQLHVPTSETTAAETQNGQSSWSGRRSVGAVSMFDIHTVESDNLPTTPANQCPLWLDEACQPVQMSASQTLLHCFLPNRERTTSQDEPSSSRALRLSIGNLSRSTRSNGADTSSDTASLLAGNKSRLSLRTSLSALAMHRAVHRSDWHANLIDTKWLDLVLFGLKQANQLARLLIQMSSSSIRTYISSPTDGNSSSTGTVLVLTGPGSGRTWQPLLTSLTQLILCPETRSLSGFEDLIEREWVRYGYPFAPDPPDWHDTAVAADYDAGATFALFLDCVHQMLYQFPAEFAFTEDYLVALLDCALSRGGGLPPFAIEFACSCDAARCVSPKGIPKPFLQTQSHWLFTHKALRSFRDWTSIYTVDGCRLFANWCYYWRHRISDRSIQLRTNDESVSNSTKEVAVCQEFDPLFSLTSPASCMRLWIHGWLRWNRSLRLCHGGGYAFDAAFYRERLCTDPLPKSTVRVASFLRPTTSATPYLGWLSDEAILLAESWATGDVTRGCLAQWGKNALVSELLKLASAWENSPDFSGS